MKNMSVVYAFSLSFLLASASVSASQEDSGKLENNQQLENNEPLNLNDIDGLIIDRTMTRFGNNFYTEFSRYINDQHEDLKENLTVKERATASQGSIISVWHAQKLVYRTTLSPGAHQAQEKAKAAADIVRTYLTRWKIQRLYSDTFDLAHDEL